MQELLNRLEANGINPVYEGENLFSPEERHALKAYFRNANRSSLVDITPVAGATETFAVNVGDHFFDPGGPGGDCSGPNTGPPIPGNYPNCGCVTTTTLTGANLEVEFLSFNVFGTFDFLNIYDGPDTSSPQLYDSNLNSTTDTLAGMIAANGSAVFTSTSGALTFEFSATAVVDSCGWEVEVLNAGGGGGGGPMDGVYAYDAGFCSDDFGTFPVAGPYNLNVISSFAIPIFSGDFDNTGTLYAMDNTNLTLITVDVNTGMPSTVGPLTNIVAGHNTRGLAWDESSGTMYLLSGLGDDVTLYTVDLATGTLTVVGTTTIPGLIGIWLAIDASGNAYMADIGLDNLYSMDLSTGTATTIGPLGINISFAQDADFDPATGILYMGAYIGGGVNQWASVDTATGMATGLGTVNADCAELGIVAIAGTSPIDNDTCATATPLACDDVVPGDTSNNTDQGGFNTAPDEWFSFTGTGTPEIVTISLCDPGTTYDSRLSVFDACGGNLIDTNDDFCGLQSQLSFNSDGTSTYYIAVEAFTTSSGPFVLSVSCAEPPVNDDCPGALPLACNSSVLGSTINSSDDSAVAPDCTAPGTTNGVWYIYEDTTGLVTDININTCSANTDYDTQISIYTGGCGTLTCVTGNDDSPNCTNFQSEVDFQSDGNTTFYILVHGFGTATGNFELTMTCTPVPPPNDMIVNSIDVDEIGFPYTDPAVAMPAATTENGNPTGCNIDGGKGVWYNFVSAGNGTATAEIVSPAGASFVTFFKAPNEMSIETDLEYFFQIGNQCAPATSANITTEAGQAYYVYVVNDGGITDIVIDGTLLSVNENVIEGFSFYPNPADETLNLSSIDTIERVAIYNLLGQEVIGQNINATSSKLDIASLSTGAYLMKVTVNGQTGVYKVIKR